MDSKQAIRHMADKSGISRRGLSAALDRSDGYVQAYIYGSRAPGADVLARWAHACGYSLCLVGHGETLTIGETDTSDEGGEG